MVPNFLIMAITLPPKIPLEEMMLKCFAWIVLRYRKAHPYICNNIQRLQSDTTDVMKIHNNPWKSSQDSNFSLLLATRICVHRFQIFTKLGVKFYDLFLWTERLQGNLNYFTVNLPLDFSELFNIFRITVFFFFFKNSRKFSKEN